MRSVIAAQVRLAGPGLC